MEGQQGALPNFFVKSLPEFVLYHDELQLQLALGFQLNLKL
jgi:hypothetical protein